MIIKYNLNKINLMEKNESKKRCITCGKINKKLCFFILGILILFIILIIIVSFYNLYAENNDIKLKDVLNYISFLFFVNLGESLMIIPGLILKKNAKSKRNDSELTQQKSDNITVYIFNPNSINFTIKEYIYLVLVGFIKLILDIITISYKYTIDKDENLLDSLLYSFQFELIFLFILAKFICKLKFYKHQYLSIIILTIIELVKFIIRHINNDIEHFFYDFLFHLVISFLKALITLYIKGLMDYKYLSAYIVTFIFGIMDFSLVLIAYIIASFIPCDEEYCESKYNETYYYAHIFEIFRVSQIFIFFINLFKAIILAFNYVIIHDFSVCHSFLLLHISQILEINVFIKGVDSIIYIIFVIIFVYGLSTFLILLFLEIIEINICGISYDTKKNIENRASIEMFISENELNVEENEDEEMEKEDKEELPSE